MALSGVVHANPTIMDINPVWVKPEQAFIPSGFDDNDNAQIVLDGWYSNTCYKSAPTEVTVDEAQKVISIKNKAYFNDAAMCVAMMVRFTDVIDLGLMRAGQYRVMVGEKQNGKFAPMGTLRIASRQRLAAQGKSLSDEVLYAPVQDVFIQLSRKEGADPVLVLRGVMTSSCMEVKEVLLRYTEGNVVEVRPIAQIKGDGFCIQKMIPFEKRVSLKDAPQGRTLIHVRSLNGKAINKVVDL